MKKFIIRILLLIAILIFLDKSIGYFFKYMQYTSKGGDTEKMVYIENKMDEEVLIFGSSRASHHYDPRIIEDSLNLTCYNCGQDGNGIIFSYGLYRLFRDRYSPKLIIYDVQENFDLINEGNNEKFLDWLRYFYDKPGIDSIFIDIDKSEKYKMISHMRWYNGKFIQIVSDNVNPKQSNIKGYKPLHSIMNYEATEANERHQFIQYDKKKLHYFKNLINDCKKRGTKLIFMVSPKYKGDKNKVYEPIILLAKSENIPFFYHYDDNEISPKQEYFEDSFHMNKYGAEIYTKKIINEIRQILNNETKTP